MVDRTEQIKKATALWVAFKPLLWALAMVLSHMVSVIPEPTVESLM
jgi:hypothetical protein